MAQLKPSGPLGAMAPSPSATTRTLAPVVIGAYAYRAGYRGDKINEAVAISLTESSGNPDSISSTDDWGLMQINRASWNGKIVPGLPGRVDWSQIKDPQYNMRVAFAISKGGQDWNPWTTYRTGAYKANLGKVPTGPGSDKIFAGIDPSGKGGTNFGPVIGGAVGAGKAVGGAVSATERAAQAVEQGIATFFTPSELGKLFGEATGFLVKFAGQSLWKYLLAPPWHWTQRATLYYNDQILGPGSGQTFIIPDGALVTMAFWSLGYALLWGEIDPPQLATAPRRTPLARSVREAQNVNARRKVRRPKDVAKATPTKPKASPTKVPVATMRRVQVSRPRPVRVHQGNGRTEQATGEQFPNAPTSGASVVASEHGPAGVGSRTPSGTPIAGIPE